MEASNLDVTKEKKDDLQKSPWWTSIVVFVTLHIGSHLSILTRSDLSISDYYLPTSLAIIFINWFGPRLVLPIVFLNAVASSYFWGNPLEKWLFWFLYAIPETMFAFLSWFLFRRVYKGKFWMPDIRNTLLFLVMGITIPVIVEIFLLQSMLVWTGDQKFNTFWDYISSNILSEYATSFFLTLPILYLVSPQLKKRNIVTLPAEIEYHSIPKKRMVLEILGIFLVMLILVFLIDFREYWFIYGFFSLYIAIRFGFGPALISNFYILILVYVLPKFLSGLGENTVGDYQDVRSIFLGSCLLFLFAAITGRVMSDVRNAEKKLLKQNAELEKKNEELDHFAYSVSHDLSAPLKSILGLVNISRLTEDPVEKNYFLSQIENCVIKLENFIAEIMDYSRNNRQNLLLESVNIRELCTEILENLIENHESQDIEVRYELKESNVIQDKTRLKIILNNLLSNAVKFTKPIGEYHPYIKISSTKNGGILSIEVEDNGAGVREDQLDRIFQMFYRGSDRSTGSGLGLYIAKEATEKINGTLIVKSEYGKGSRFIVNLRA